MSRDRASAPATRRRVLHWIVLALVPSGLMLATSTYITTDIVAMPLLWVLPLGLYLLSFTIAFAANRELADLLTRIAPITILLFGGVMMGGFNERPLVQRGDRADAAVHGRRSRCTPRCTGCGPRPTG